MEENVPAVRYNEFQAQAILEQITHEKDKVIDLPSGRNILIFIDDNGDYHISESVNVGTANDVLMYLKGEVTLADY